MLVESIVATLIASSIPVEAYLIAPRCRDKFGDCECTHLELCDWYVPTYDLEHEFDLLRHHIREHSGDKAMIKELDLLEKILPDEPEPSWNFRAFNWEYRLARARKCARLCKHHSKCHVVREIPQTITEGPPHDGLAWRWDPLADCYRCDDPTGGGKYISGRDVYEPKQIANPAWEAVAYPERREAPPKQTAADGLKRKRLEQQKATITASSSAGSQDTE